MNYNYPKTKKHVNQLLISYFFLNAFLFKLASPEAAVVTPQIPVAFLFDLVDLPMTRKYHEPPIKERRM